MAQNYGNLGNMYMQQEKWDEAEKNYRIALKTFEELKAPLEIAATYGNLGIVYRNQGKWDEAEEYHNKALELDEQLGNPLGMANNYGSLGILYKSQEQYEEAFPYLMLGFGIAGSLGAESVIKIIGEHLADLREKVGEAQFSEWQEEFVKKVDESQEEPFDTPMDESASPPNNE